MSDKDSTVKAMLKSKEIIMTLQEKGFTQQDFLNSLPISLAAMYLKHDKKELQDFMMALADATLAYYDLMKVLLSAKSGSD